MAHPVTEFDDIQALVYSGFGQLLEATFLVVRITDASAAKAWLRQVTVPSGTGYRITTIADLKKSQPRSEVLQIAFTAEGLAALGVEDDLIGGFSREFHDGMASDHARCEGRPRRLGDEGANAPDYWRWGAGDKVCHAVLMLYGNEDRMAAFVAGIKAELTSGFSVMETFGTTYRTQGSNDRIEHFGFVDGISQPTVDWHASRNPDGSMEFAFGNLVTPGEFLLGYANEYGLYEDRPLLSAERDNTGVLSPAEDVPDMRDLARNGSYLVFRQLEQDVEGFWRFLSARSPDDHGVSLAEAMVGRSLANGNPLAQPTGLTIPGVDKKDAARNGFLFEGDKDGWSCPFGAHVRRANPRTADMPGGPHGLLSRVWRMLGFNRAPPREDLISSARFHRILRRGRAYGPFTDRETAIRPDSTAAEPRGLHFICLNANISRQFEFVQNAWLGNPTFNGLSGEGDPLLGNRRDFPAGRPTDGFSMPQASGASRRVSAMPRFVTVRGGAYFFLPSPRAIRFFAR